MDSIPPLSKRQTRIWLCHRQCTCWGKVFINYNENIITSEHSSMIAAPVFAISMVVVGCRYQQWFAPDGVDSLCIAHEAPRWHQKLIEVAKHRKILSAKVSAKKKRNKKRDAAATKPLGITQLLHIVIGLHNFARRLASSSVFPMWPNMGSSVCDMPLSK